MFKCWISFPLAMLYSADGRNFIHVPHQLSPLLVLHPFNPWFFYQAKEIVAVVFAIKNGWLTRLNLQKEIKRSQAILLEQHQQRWAERDEVIHDFKWHLGATEEQ